jgi:hypothetical protein
MIRLSSWTHEVDGRVFSLRPLTVRERIALGEALADSMAGDAARDARAAGMTPREAVAEARTARDEARKSSALVMSCFSLAGAMRVLDRACEDAGELIAAVEPQVSTTLALAALGIDIEEHERKATEGNT